MVKESYFMIDAFAQRDNLFTRMDARIKVLFCIAALSAIIGLPGYKLSLAVIASMSVVMVFLRTPVRMIAGRIIPPLLFGLVVFGFMLFFQKGHPLFTLDIAGFQLVGYSEGLYLGITVLTRIVASVSILLFLSITTPVHELGYALIWLRFPKVIVEILLLTYRYLFVLWDEGVRIRQAQTLRLGYPAGKDISGWKRALNSTCTLMGIVFIRAYDRAESTFAAMQVRAYNGEITGNAYKTWNRSQTRYLLSAIVVLLAIMSVAV